MPRQSLRPPSLVSLVLILAALACGLPDFQVATPVPTPLPVDAPPLPSVTLTFNVHVAPSTPASTTIAAQLLDPVRGNRTLVALINVSPGVWSGSASVPEGALIRYRYLRTGPTAAEEVTGARAAVPYRVVLAEPGGTTADDIVAAWSDGAPDASQGIVIGTIRNRNTNEPIGGILVSVGGQLAWTAGDGVYTVYNVPAGLQRVTMLAPSGGLRPLQASVNVGAGATAVLDLSSPDPNSVSVTFVFTPPGGTDAASVPRLIGDVAQLGDTFAFATNGTSVVGARAPRLYPLGDGRFATAVQLYEGTVVRYAYTLGDGYWSGELDATGARRVREYRVPWTNDTRSDNGFGWHSGPSQPVVFDLSTPGTTPTDDVVAIQFLTTDWMPPVPMWAIAPGQWRFTLHNPTDVNGDITYRFCRNFACGAADEVLPGNARGRVFTFTLLPQSIRNAVGQWRWLDAETPVAVDLPSYAARPGFQSGISLSETWSPSQLATAEELANEIAATGANTTEVLRRSTLLSLNPPVYGDDPTLTMPADELARLAQVLRDRHVETTLHSVTCAYTPYGNCEYWNGAPTTQPGWWDAWFAAYSRHVLTQVDAANHAGITSLIIGDYRLRPSLPGEPEAAPTADAQWRLLIAQVRARFRGRIGFALLLGQDIWPNPPAFLDSVDYIRLETWAPLGASGSASVTDIAFTASALLDARVAPLAGRFGKPITLGAYYPSVDGGVTQCVRQSDGSCAPISVFAPDAPINGYALDLAEQADVYNGLLIAVAGRPYITGFFAAGYNAQVALRDQSLSVRGKPAEKILTAWYARLR